MHALLIGILVAATAAVLLFAGARVWARTPDQPASSQTSVTQPATATPAEPAKPWTREEIAKRLKQLATGPTPQNLHGLGAKCYKTAAPPISIEYICPVDGERTSYPLESPAYYSIQDIRSINALFGQLRGVAVRIDESEFCRKCHPDVTDPQLVLYVKFHGSSKEHRVRGVGYNDLKLMKEFLSGHDVHRSRSDAETPLKDHLPRLQELLGVTILK